MGGGAGAHSGMNAGPKELAFSGRLVMVGFGCIGRGVLPLLFRHIDVSPSQIVVLHTSNAGADVARHFGVRHLIEPLAADNFSRVLEPLLGPGDFLLNLSVTGPQHGFLITHGESISIADHFTLGDPAQPDYRPTVHHAYHPCDDAVLSLHELAERNWRLQPKQRILMGDTVGGVDALGVLLMGHAKGAYWYGSQLTVQEARALCPHNTATSLQVTASMMAGVVWALRNPERGVTEPDDMPFDEILALCRPYLGQVVGVFSDWTPLHDRSTLFVEQLDREDPWQFDNFRVD